MGWAARNKFKGNYNESQCNKCNDTGVRGYKLDYLRRERRPIKCKCVILKEIEQKRMDDLAKQAVESLEARKDENVEEWAKNLAADVADAND